MTREQALLMREAISEAAQYLPDEKALKYSFLFPTWREGDYYPEGFKMMYQDKMYRSLQPHVGHSRWLPPESLNVLYEEVIIK